MTLLEECKALVENRDNWVFTDQLRAIIRRHEHDDWKGPWICVTCGKVYGYPYHPIECSSPHDGWSETCSRNLVPYERRHSERRKARSLLRR